jgi:hypothetical protein
MQGLTDVVGLIGFFVASAFIVRIIFDYKIRAKLIEKGMVDENVKYLYAQRPETQSLSSLKWGIILIAVGLPVFIGRVVMIQTVPPDTADAITIGGMLVCSGLGLCLYYLIASRKMRKIKGNNTET